MNISLKYIFLVSALIAGLLLSGSCNPASESEEKVNDNINLNSQILEPVEWEFAKERTADNGFILIMEADIDPGWHVYSQHIAEGGPVPTEIIFDSSAAFQLIGDTEEKGELEEAHDPNFDMQLKWFSNEMQLLQKVKLLKKKAKITGYIYFMTCDDKRCLPPERVPFEYNLTAKSGAAEDKEPEDKQVPEKAGEDYIKENNDKPDNKDLIKEGREDEIEQPVLTEEDTIVSDQAKKEKKRSLWTIFVAGFLGGLIALITPCVFPMIPLTVSFFTKRSSDNKKGVINAFLYGLSIIVIYVGLGFIITKLLGSDALNEMASNIWFNLAFFLIFIIFAISFFGAFEITLPSSWVNKADAASEKGGLIGIFFMAFTLALVSFSCTGPIIGTLLVEAAVGGSDTGPLVGMAGFAIALAFPFGFFAAFPGWLNALPKSGGWLNSVKVVLGFLELALALKFLSNVDLAYHWGILDREVFLVLWIIIFAMLGFYLLGKLQFSNDSELKHITIPRLFFSIISFAFALYMIPGLWGAPLKALSAFAPPPYTQDFISLQKQDLSTFTFSTADTEHKVEDKKYADLLHCPLGLDCFFDYEEGLEYAAKVNKPVLLDFTGHTCVNCRKMENQVWSEDPVYRRLNEDFVLISLYVDEKRDLPEEEQFISDYSGKKITTIGNKWSDLQASRFRANTQPYYVPVDTEGNLLTEPVGYTPDMDEYIDFLDKAKKRFRQKQTK